MKLIDADNLKDDGCNYVWAETIGFGLVKKEYRFVNRIQIDNAPTVEAIPIEWIKTYAANLDRGYRCFQDDSSDIGTMLNDWEKENGDSDNLS